MNRPVSYHKCPLICNCKYTTIIYKSNHMDLFHFEISLVSNKNGRVKNLIK